MSPALDFGTHMLELGATVERQSAEIARLTAERDQVDRDLSHARSMIKVWKGRCERAQRRAEEMREENNQLNARLHCMCGSPVDTHGVGDGHSPVSMFDYSLQQCEERLAKLTGSARSACDLLTERTQGSPARSPGHNARLVLERALDFSTAKEG